MIAVTVTHCDFLNNTSPVAGGAILASGQLSISHCSFHNNSAGGGQLRKATPAHSGAIAAVGEAQRKCKSGEF